MSNPVRIALWSKLNGDATLTGLLATSTAIYWSVAPAGAAFPFIVMNKQAGTPIWQFADRADNELYQVKAIDKNTTAGRAEDIAARVDVVLNRAKLTIGGKHHLSLIRESDVDYSETDEGSLYFHVGGMYRLVTEPA